MKKNQPPTSTTNQSSLTRLNSFISSCANFASNSWGAMAAPEDPNVGNSQMRDVFDLHLLCNRWPCLHRFAPTASSHRTCKKEHYTEARRWLRGARIPEPHLNPVTLKTSNSCLLPSYHVFCIYFVHEGRDWIWIHQIRHGDMQVKCCFWFCIHYHTAFASPVFKRLEGVMLLHDSL